MNTMIDNIFLGDCLQYMPTLPDCSVDLVLTDPPYRITAKGNSGNTGGFIANKDTFNGKLFPICSPREWMPQVYRILKNNSHCYIMCNHINLVNFITTAQEAGFHFIKALIWDK